MIAISNWNPPKPKERTSRPRLSVSPVPRFKKNPDNSLFNGTKYQDRCNSLYYRRHVEQHLERVFKYLRDRAQRLLDFEKEITNVPEDQQSKISALLSKKESQYLRSLRARISRSDFTEIKKLGHGHIGNVWLVEMKPRGRVSDKDRNENNGPLLFAMKRLKLQQVYQENHMAHVMAERDILAEADNEWIVKLFYSFQDSNHLYFILEYVPGGDMMTLLINEQVLSEEWARFYISEVALALQFVHSMNFIHRDMKPDNILIDRRGHIKLADFGLCTGFRWTHDLRYYKDDSSLSKPVDNNNFGDHPTITKDLTEREFTHSLKKKTLSVVGSPNYIAPEVLRLNYLNQEIPNEKLCDWWSVGVILYEMVIGYCPFIDLKAVKSKTYDPNFDDRPNIQMRIMNWQKYLAFPSPTDPDAPPLSCTNGQERYISEETKSLITGLLCDPQDRLCRNGIQDIIEHPFFRGVDWENIRNLEAPYVPKLENDYDTRHFESYPSNNCESIEHDNGFGSSTRIPIADFTFQNFWQKPGSRY